MIIAEYRTSLFDEIPTEEKLTAYFKKRKVQKRYRNEFENTVTASILRDSCSGDRRVYSRYDLPGCSAILIEHWDAFAESYDASLLLEGKTAEKEAELLKKRFNGLEFKKGKDSVDALVNILTKK